MKYHDLVSETAITDQVGALARVEGCEGPQLQLAGRPPMFRSSREDDTLDQALGLPKFEYFSHPENGECQLPLIEP